MKIIDRSFEVLYPGREGLAGEWQAIERAARTCYQSVDKITDDSYKTFCKMLLDKDHGAMLEFGRMRVKFITGLATANEFVLHHRLCSFAQESTRYVNYKDDITVIAPSTWKDMSDSQQTIWQVSMIEAGRSYKELIENGCKPQTARDVLPLSLKTELIVDANFREWTHIFELGFYNEAAHPDMIATLKPLANFFWAGSPKGIYK
jgi:thymidylate synthase (FAD)